MLNKVQLIGRLGLDPQLKYAQTGSPIANFTVATDESFTDREGIRQERTEWHRVVVFQKTAENCSRYLHKGSLVYVEGSLQTRKWTDQQGMDHYMTEVKAQRVIFLDKRQVGDEMGAPRRFPARPQGDGYPQAPDSSYGMPRDGGYGADQRYMRSDYGQENTSPFIQDASGERENLGPSENSSYGHVPYGSEPAQPQQQTQSQAQEGGVESSKMDQVPF